MVRVGVFSLGRGSARANVAAVAIAATATATATAVDVVVAIATMAVASAVEVSTVVAAVYRATGAGSGCTVIYRSRGNSSTGVSAMVVTLWSSWLLFCWGGFGAKAVTNFS